MKAAPPPPIDGNTQLVGLIGWPVGHSMSPAMHNAAFDALGLNWRYVPLPVPTGQVGLAIQGLGALGFRGANVTVPHKQAARLALAKLFGPNAVAPNAESLGAINTLLVDRDEDGRPMLQGHNTDAQGFVSALRDSGVEPTGTSVVVVGAGGAARAAVFGLMEVEAERIVVLNRTPERAATLVSDLSSSKLPVADRSPVSVQALPLTKDALIETARAAELLVNATPVGMWPNVDDSIWPDGVSMPPHLTVFDMVYNPLETKLHRQAQASGAITVDGLGMLVRQGALALEIWTGEQAPLQAMRAACERSLQA